MKISEIPEYKDKKSVFMREEDEPLTDAVNEMCKQNFGSVIVTRGGKLCGIVTERDLMKKVLNMGRDPTTLTLGDVMTPDPKITKEDDLVVDGLRRMSEGHFRHLPIVDEDGNVVGMVSQGDFVAYTWPQIFHRAAENARSFASMGGTQVVLIIAAVMLYTIALIFTMQG